MKPNLVIDLDGTLTTDAWPLLGEWMPGAVSALHVLVKACHVIVFTCRIAPVSPNGFQRHPGMVRQEINMIQEKLNEEGLYTVEIWDKPWKPPAVAYVDNRGVRYSGTPKAWAALTPKLLNMVGEFELAAEAYGDTTEVYQ